MRPRIRVMLTPDDQITVAKWSRRMGAAAMMFLAAVGVWVMLNPYLDGDVAANASERPNDPTCITWDTRASEAIATFVQGSKQDIDLIQVSDMITKMRRARRNCQLGWSSLACGDYRAIVGVVETNPNVSVGCGPTTAADSNATVEVITRR